MKKLFPLTLLTALLLVSPSLSLRSQTLESGYFLGGNPFAFRLNPAFQSERSILSIGLGGTEVGEWSNLGFSTLFYPDNATGELYTFMHDRVSSAEFLGKLNRRNVLDADLNLNLLTLGFWSGPSFITIDFNVRSIGAASVPYDVFRFLKEGTTATDSFDFSGVGVAENVFLEAAVGWSRNYDDVFSAGLRFKGLVGLAEAEMTLPDARVTLNDNRWEASARDGHFYASSPALTIERNQDGYLDLGSLSTREGIYKPAGFGGAIDLGFSWNVLPDLTLSGAVLDLGLMHWNREIQGLTPSVSYTWEPDGEEGPEDFDAMITEVGQAFRFQDVSGSSDTGLTLLPVRYHLGAEYRMPFYDRLSVGALYMGRSGAPFNRNAGRLSLNWNPLDFLSLSTGTTLNRFGESLGFALNLHPAGINLLLGCDYIPLKVAKIDYLLGEDFPDQYRRFAVVPVNQMKLNLYVGLNIAFGHRRLDYAKRLIY